MRDHFVGKARFIKNLRHELPHLGIVLCKFYEQTSTKVTRRPGRRTLRRYLVSSAPQRSSIPTSSRRIRRPRRAPDQRISIAARIPNRRPEAGLATEYDPRRADGDLAPGAKEAAIGRLD